MLCCTDVAHPYPFICRWVPGVLPCPVCCKTVLQCTLRCMYPFRLGFSPGNTPGVWWLGHTIVLVVVSRGTSGQFCIEPVSVYLPTNSVGGFPLPLTLSSVLLFVDVWRWPFWLVWGDNLVIVLICISVRISDIEHLFVSFGPSKCLLWRNVHLDLLPIFHFYFLIYWAAQAVGIFWNYTLVSCFVCK